MKDIYRKLLLENVLTLLNEFPVACNVLVDTKGRWDIRDFEKVWANAAYNALFSRSTSGPLTNRLEPNKIKTMQALWDQVRHAIEAGADGFIGPFSNHYIKPDMTLIVIEHHILYLGETEKGSPAFFTVVHDKTADEYRSQMEKTVVADRDRSAWQLLSIRERTVAKLVCKGFITKEIADQLGVSERTIDNHRANIRKKLHLPRAVGIAEYLGIKPSQ